MNEAPGTAAAPTRWRALFAAVLRESRASRGRLFFFTLCLALGVAAVVGVSSLVSTIRVGMAGESRHLLAADLRVSARRPLPDSVANYFRPIPHRRADLVEMGAMALAPERAAHSVGSRLVELKVVDAAYPLYGKLKLDPPQLSAGDLGDDRVFIGPDLAASLELAVGDRLELGGASFEVAALVVDEPDQLDFAMTLGPRVFMGPAGLERTKLSGARSRVRYVSLYAVDSAVVPVRLKALERGLEAVLGDASYVRVRAHTEAQPNVSRSLGRVEDYLGLVALLSLLLGGVGLSQIVRAWLAGRTQGVAVMRCLGFRAREIAALYLGHVALLAVAGCLLGGVLGSLLPWVVRGYAPSLFVGADVDLWQPAAFARGVGLGLFVATLFSLPPLTAVWRVPPATVLRAEAAPIPVPPLVRFGAPALLLAGVLVAARVQSGAWFSALAFSGGLLVLTALLYAGARLASVAAERLPRGRFGPYLEHGFAALARPGAGTTGAIVALGIGVMVVVSMWLIESRLSHALRTALPPDAPSVFLADIQPDQWEGVRTTLEARGARSLDTVPVVMARLRELDGRDVRELAAERQDDGRATWVLTREQRLTWLDELDPSNELIAGELWSDPTRAEVSLEDRFADDLGVGLGAVLELDVQGVPFEFTVTSLRKVDWQSFGINFFLVVEPGVLEDAPHLRIAAARLDTAEQEFSLQGDLVASFPNVTVIRVRPILERVADVLERLAFGIRALGSFTIVTGLVILAGAVVTTALRRSREAALLKTLGVTRGGVTRLFAVEYALIGLLAGSLGAVGALALAWAFLVHLAELDVDLPLSSLPFAALATAALATLSGLAASVRALRARPLDTLRA
ncbi:MAG: FtsX-like permease family protein [Planctomycetes bacterium]|nr:FtsX-like permease family protein [Planctomycetota bacterium]MCB9902884.1 FtsX-like permease family protein [Planctomycetota bacterium]